MRHSQRGVTFIGWLFLLIPVAIVVYAGIRLAPIYLNYMRVVEGARSADGQRGQGRHGRSAPSAAPVARRSTSTSRASSIPTTKDIDIHRDGEHWVAIADYEDVAPLFGNISLLVQFDKEVELQ